MINLATLYAFKRTQNMVGKFETFEDWPTSDPYCAKSGPNTYQDFLYVVLYSIILQKNKKLDQTILRHFCYMPLKLGDFHEFRF